MATKSRISSIPRKKVSVDAHERSMIEHRVPSEKDIDQLMWQVYDYIENTGESYAQFAKRTGLSVATVYRLVAEEIPTVGFAAKTLRALLHAGVDIHWYTDKYFPNLFSDLQTSDFVAQMLELGIAFAGYDAEPQDQLWSQQRTMLVLGIGARLARLEGTNLEEGVNYMYTLMQQSGPGQPVRMDQVLDAKSMQAVVDAASGELRLLSNHRPRKTRKRATKKK